MKKRIIKLLAIAIVGCFFVFNLLFSSILDQSSITLSSLIATTNVNAEDFENCYMTMYNHGPYLFGFCGYETGGNSCICGTFIPH